MRVGIVSPYSYTYPGGVGRHAEALTTELIDQGHEARLFAPFDPDDRLARVMHRGAAPEPLAVPDYLFPLGRTVGLPMNGSVTNLALTPEVASRLGRELRQGNFDVVHVHEPNAPVASWFATEAARVPLVGTFHTYSRNPLVGGLVANVAGARRLYNKLGVRIAVSDAARWTCERFYGGEYRIIPNGVDLAAGRPDHRYHGGPLEILFVGRAEHRKGLPVLLRAYEALREAGVAACLTVAGATHAEVAPLLFDTEGVTIAGRVTEDEKWRLLGRADVLCAPSLGGESFGMVLTEAFASHTPVIASDIAGYRDVVRHGHDGLLVPAGDAALLGEALRSLALNPGAREGMARSAAARAARFSWHRVTEEVQVAYADAIELPRPERRGARAAARAGLIHAGNQPVVRPSRLASIEPSVPGARGRLVAKAARRLATAAAMVGGLLLAALAVRTIGIDSIAGALGGATPVWVLTSLALMCASMLLRAEAWHAILRAALPNATVRRRDTARATMVGVLMSATLPARLGEPSRAVIMARHLGSVRDRFPIVLGSLVSQTMLNILALVVLGSVMFATVGIFRGGEDALVVATLAPLVLLGLVFCLPALLRRGKPSRSVRVQRAVARARSAVMQVRHGLEVFHHPKLGARATVAQLAAWALQWLACYALLVALGLDYLAGPGAAAAVLFAVNVTAAIPITPSNLGVFQAACVAVLSAYGVAKTDALAYGIILQAVEIATAFALGMPALVAEGMTWKDLRLRALNATPVELPAAESGASPAI